jgi:eukaryotic-like serine/threonine-protein kinase
MFPSVGMADVTVPLRETAATDEPALPRGSSFARYLILDKVGEGGVGEVYAAYDPHLDRRIALKILRPGPRFEGATPSDDDVQWRKLVREAKALAKLSDAHVVTVHDVGAFEGRTFLAMELVDGIDLGAWLQRRSGNPAEILRVLVDAGRGLAAAHAAGVIHRDFKPANVLVGADGRVKVGDFGLARLRDDGTGDAVRIDRTRETRIDAATTDEHSAVGGVPGTPNYMAPELFAGHPADVRSDVYAYCVTLHEALFGERPFTASTLTALVTAKEEGPREPPSKKGVPRPIVRAIMRGLAPRPEERWADMPTLLAALGQAPSRGWRRVVPFAGIAVAGAAALALARPDQSACADAERHLQGVGDEGARARLREAIVGSERSFAAATAADVDATIEAWSGRWVAAHVGVCEASVHGEQSAAALDARMACLRDGRAELAALLDVIGSPAHDGTEVERASILARGLPSPEWCAELQPDARAIEGADAPGLRERLARAKVLLRASRGADARTLALEVQGDAQGEPRVAVEAAVAAARGTAALGDYDEAERALEAALFEAQALGHPEVQVDAALGLSHVLATRSARYADAMRWASYAEAEQRRAELPDEVRSRVLDAKGVALHGRGDHDAAIAVYEESLALLAEAGADELVRAAPLDNLGNVLRAAGRYPDAIAKHEEALAIRERLLGPDHPDVARTLGNLASSLLEAGRNSEALEQQARALEIRERAFGASHPDVATTLNNLAGVHYNLGQYAESEAAARRALAIREAVHGPDHQQSASTHGTMGLALSMLGRPDEALEHHRRALAIHERELGPTHPRTNAARSNLAMALSEAGKLDESVELYRAAIAATEATDGPKHPYIAGYVSNLGDVLAQLERYDEAREMYERALAVRDEVLDPKHPDFVFTLVGLASVHIAQEHADLALPLLDRAQVIAEHGETAPGLRGAVKFTRAQALEQLGEHETAIASASAAEADYRAAGKLGERFLGEVAAWRRAHP